MRIAIVNDLIMTVEALRRVLISVSEYEIAWIAYNGAEAVEKCEKDRPDLILMDLIMPIMDGVQATATIMKNTPCPILVVTATVTGNAAKVFEAMGFGALDAVCTPVFGANGRIEGKDELIRKINTIKKFIGKNGPSAKAESSGNISSLQTCPLVAIGCSTGGPKALADILSNIPGNIGASIVIVQHVDVQFAKGLADWLNEQSKLKVTIAEEGSQPEKDTVYIAETNDHLVITPELTFNYTVEPANYPYRPSVDTFFQSLDKNWPRKDCAILLTGIGQDGAKGLASLMNSGWHTIAQDEKTSVVYGMPKKAAELGAAKEILPLDKMVDAITRFLNITG